MLAPVLRGHNPCRPKVLAKRQRAFSYTRDSGVTTPLRGASAHAAIDVVVTLTFDEGRVTSHSSMTSIPPTSTSRSTRTRADPGTTRACPGGAGSRQGALVVDLRISPDHGRPLARLRLLKARQVSSGSLSCPTAMPSAVQEYAFRVLGASGLRPSSTAQAPLTMRRW
jgi:hypothetical protein